MKISYFLLIIITSALPACLVPEEIKQERAFFQAHIENNPHLLRQTLTVGKDQLFYAAAGDEHKPALVIIHGTPGNWQQYARYMLDKTLLRDFYVVVIDRPGWGASQSGDDETIIGFSHQGAIIAALANELKRRNGNQPVILMGHSLGASIAPRVAMDHPDAVDGLLLFAGSFDPEVAHPRWFNYVAETRVVDWLLSEPMRKANDEIFAMNAELVAMAPHWRTLETPLIYVQGMKDSLVYPSNSRYAREHFNPDKAEVIELAEEDHLFPMTRREDVVAWARCLLSKINAPYPAQTQSLRCAMVN